MSYDTPVEKSTGFLMDADTYNGQIIRTLLYLLQGVMVGNLVHSIRTTDVDEHWLICDGRTIGNASSGATARANADMETLFVHLWNNADNTVLPIQDSSGSATTRGASGAADFAANKRMPIPDARGRTLIGLDGSAGRIADSWADNVGGSGGASTHVLSIGEMPSHTHGPGAGTSFLNGITPGGGGALAGGTGVTSSVATASAGSGSAHNNVQPSLAVNILICTGV